MTAHEIIKIMSWCPLEKLSEVPVNQIESPK